MKQTFVYISCLFIFLFTSCHISKNIEKNTTKIAVQSENELIGKWKLVKLTGGFIGKEQNPPMEQIQLIEFTPTEMILTVNGKEVSRTTYSLNKGKSIHQTEEVPMIFPNGSFSIGTSYEVNQNQLILREEFADGFNKHYERLEKGDDGIPRK